MNLVHPIAVVGLACRFPGAIELSDQRHLATSRRCIWIGVGSLKASQPLVPAGAL
jgi:hypothetical protein